MATTPCDTFIVAFRGEVIECDSLRDAIGLKRAAQISTPSDERPRELEKLADLLERYERLPDADDLRGMAALIRKMECVESRKIGWRISRLFPAPSDAGRLGHLP